MNNILFLGIGSNYFAQLSTAAFAVEMAPNEWLLVDCGPDTPKQLARAGVPFLNVRAVLITHRHLDHCLGLPYFLFGRNLDATAKRRQERDFLPPQLQVMAEPAVREHLLSTFEMAYPDGKLEFEIASLDIADFLGSPRRFFGHSIQVYKMNHTVPAYGFVLFLNGKKRIAYSSDTLPSDEFIAGAAGVNVLIHEAMIPASEVKFSTAQKHSTTRDAGEVIAAIKPQQALLIHIRPAFMGEKAALEAEVASAAGMRARYPDEGELVKIA